MKIFFSLWQNQYPVMGHEIDFDETQKGIEKFTFPINTPKNLAIGRESDGSRPKVKVYFENDNSVYDVSLDKNVKWGADNITGIGDGGELITSNASFEFEIVGDARSYHGKKLFWNCNVKINKFGELFISSDYLPRWHTSK